jgi:hypothetical protein
MTAIEYTAIPNLEKIRIVETIVRSMTTTDIDPRRGSVKTELHVLILTSLYTMTKDLEYSFEVQS